AGRFILDLSNTLSDAPQFWGVATLQTNFSKLESFGIFLFASGTLQINTTEYTKTETLTLPGLNSDGSDQTRTFVLPPTSFALDLLGQLRFRPPGVPTDLFRLSGGFVLKIDPTRFTLFVTASFSEGIGAAEVTFGKATGLLVLQTGLKAGDNFGIAGYLKVSAS